MLNGINLRLETERLILRSMLATDIDALHLIFTDPNVMTSFGGELLNHDQMQRWHRISIISVNTVMVCSP